jgi:hypothetical protein
MTIEQLTIILANRLSTLSAQRSHAVTVGDLAQVAILDADIAETEITLSQLKQVANKT